MDQGTGVHKPFRTLEEMALRVTKGQLEPGLERKMNFLDPKLKRIPDRALVESANPEMVRFCTQSNNVLDRRYEGNDSFKKKGKKKLVDICTEQLCVCGCLD